MRKHRNGSQTLSSEAAQWGLCPTPTVTGNANRSGNSEKSGDGLETAARTWATPCTRDHQGPTGEPTKGGRNLARDARLWPTPCTSDEQASRDTFSRGESNPTLGGLVRQLDFPSGPPDPTTETAGSEPSRSTRQLNPRFVEWLMGWPLGWSDPSGETASDSSGTASCPQPPRSPSALSRNGSEG